MTNVLEWSVYEDEPPEDEPHDEAMAVDPSWPLPALRDAYDKIRTVRRGAQGVVYQARKKAARNEVGTVAIKRYIYGFQEYRERGVAVAAVREPSILLGLNLTASGGASSSLLPVSPADCMIHAVDVVGAPHGEVCLVMECCPIDLESLIVDRRVHLSLDGVRCVMRNLLCALAWLHHPECRRGPHEVASSSTSDSTFRSNAVPEGSEEEPLGSSLSSPIMHRDVKLSNILISHSGLAKLSDFGSARPVSRSDESSEPTLPQRLTPPARTTTLLYRAPELLLGCASYSTKVDCWAAGVVFGELLLGQHLFRCRNELELLHHIFRLAGTPTQESWPEFAALPVCEHFTFASTHSTAAETFHHILATRFRISEVPVCETAVDLLLGLLTVNPAQRLDARAALRHPFFTDPRLLPPCPFTLRDSDEHVVRSLLTPSHCVQATTSMGGVAGPSPLNGGSRPTAAVSMPALSHLLLGDDDEDDDDDDDDVAWND